MAAEPRRAPIMTLQQLVAKYQSLAKGFGVAVPLSGFGLTKPETEGEKYHIDGVPATHLAIDAEITKIL